MRLSRVERTMKGIPEVTQLNIRLSIELNRFNSWELLFLDPIHKFPWAILLIGDFGDFVIGKDML